MNNFKKLNEIWEQVPPDYYEKGIKTNFLQRLWHFEKVKNFKFLTSKNSFKKILDVGCFSGTFTNQISNIFPKSDICGVDIYSPAISHGKRKYPHIHFKVSDAHKLPFHKNYFDLVICYETIEHVANPQLVLAEIKRVMKKGGLAIVAMDSGNLLFRLIWWFWIKSKGKVWQGAHLHPFHHNHLEKVIKSVGFKILKKHFSHFGMEVSFLLKK